jgi:hypothetical protein
LVEWEELQESTLSSEEIMRMKKSPIQAEYDPNPLFDTLIKKLKLKNDAALARKLDVTAPVISKIRHRTLRIGATMLVRMHEASELPVQELRNLMGKPHRKVQ